MHAAASIYGDVPSLAMLLAAYRAVRTELVARRTTILEFLARETIVAPPTFPFLRRVNAVRQLRIPPEELISRFSQTFTELDLVASGVARRHNDRLRLSRVCGTQESSFRFRYCDKRRVDAVAAASVLSGSRELARLASEPCTSTSVSEQPYVVTDSDGDSRLLQQLGLPVTSAAPLHAVKRNTISPFLTVRHPSKHARRWLLVVPIGRPHTLNCSIPQSALETAQQLDRVSRCYDLECGTVFRAWYPPPHEVRRFREVSQLKDGKLLSAEFRRSLATSTELNRSRRQLNRERKQILAPLVAAGGLRFHGRTIRAPRWRVVDQGH